MSSRPAPVKCAQHDLRYGFGQIMPARRSVDLRCRRACVGTSASSYAGFEQNIRSAITFGKPWRSCVQVGAGTSAISGRARWNPPCSGTRRRTFLMGASVVRTDLPGALVARAGLYIAYDIAYRLANRVTLKGQVSYGSRDGAAHFGGGFGTAVAFWEVKRGFCTRKRIAREVQRLYKLAARSTLNW